MDASCDFEYLNERLTLSFSSRKIQFVPKTVAVKYGNQTIFNATFDKKCFNINEIFSVVVPFRKFPIDFFGFSKERIFNIAFVFVLNGTSLLESHYSITLPVLKQLNLCFKPPSMCMPEAKIRQICNQEFKMGLGDTPEAIKLVILLEEFKLMPAVERYKVYGYVDMLSVFIDIENSFELNLLKKGQITSTRVVKETAINYRINVSQSDRIFPNVLNTLTFRHRDKSHRQLHQFV